LLATLLFATTIASALAVTDGVNYDAVNGIKIKNLWIQDRAHTQEVWGGQPYCNTYARTAVMHDGYIYITRSNANTVIQGTDTLLQSVVYKLDAATGNLIKELPLTLDGAVYGGATLSANMVGADNFGHLYIAPYTSELATESTIYLLDGETGELTLVDRLEKGDVLARCDYMDVMGDLTREEAECNIMAVGTSSDVIYRWHADQGDDFEGGFDGDTYLSILDFYPETVTQWGYAPVVKMILGEDEDTRYSADLFYIDGFTTSPILYDVTGTMVDNFEEVDPDFWPMDVGANGVCEFTLEGRNFIVYVAAQYTGVDETTMVNKACQSYICELGEGMSLGGMQRYWMVPDELGAMSDGGTRVQSMNVEYGTDAEGNEEVTLFIFKCYNGMAVYKIGTNVDAGGDVPSTPGDVNGDGEVNIADVNAIIDMILSGNQDKMGDVNGDGEVNIADVNAEIDLILG
ncbi:MAG: dockerin type I repeat-containing protein, partial [Muribaculaceae bacterium]|nr:dockerin type I repeat-containing protein [Muribaculaceae bacterium]